METDFQKIILNNAPCGFCILNEELELEFITSRLLSLLNFKFDDIQGIKWIQAILNRNFHGNKEKIFKRWLTSKIKKTKKEINVVSKIMDDLRSEFLIHILPIENKSYLLTVFVLNDAIHLLKGRVNQKLYREYRIAGKIQKNMNDYIIEMIEGRYFKYHFKRIFLPSSFLSGDIVNIKTVSRRYSSVFIGDGRGHGLPAALYSSLINSYLNIMAKDVSEGHDSTGSLIKSINESAFRDFTGSGEYYFFSGFYGLIDGNGKEFIYTNAGHPYPFLIRDENISRLESNGPLVGVFEEADFTQTRLELKGGDLIIFFTDGFYELFPDDTIDETGSVIEQTVKSFISKDKWDESSIIADFQNFINQRRQRFLINDDISILFFRVEEKISQ